MGKFGDRLLAAIGIEEVPVYEDDYYEEEEQYKESIHADRREKARRFAKNNKEGKVIRMYDYETKVMIYKPVGFDQAQDIVNHLEHREQLIIDLDDLDKETAQRIVDFISGATYSLRGHICKISRNIFLAIPDNVELESSEEKQDTEYENSFYDIQYN